MAVLVKPIAASAEKFVSRAQGAATEYQTEAAAAGPRWQSETVAAAGNYKQGISAANIEARFRAGVQKAGAAKYARKITEVGGARFSQGVAVAKDAWATGFAPYGQVIAGLTLSARRPRGDPGNLQRVSQGNVALHARRLAQLGGAS